MKCPQRPQDRALSYRKQSRDRRRVLKLFDDAVREANPPAQGAGPEEPSPSFELFPTLPPELRLIIWKFALTLGGARTLSADLGAGGMTRAWSARLAMPRIARVNREARGVALTAVRITERPKPLRDMLRGWALPGDSLEVKAVMNNPATASGFEQDMPAFASVAASFGHFVDHSERSRIDLSMIPMPFKRVRTILVAVQTIHIIINTGDAAAKVAKVLSVDQDQPFISTDVEPDSPSAATNLSVHDAGLIKFEAEPVRISTVVALSDRARIEEFLAIGTAVGQFGDLGSRLLALESHANAYCLDDCLQRWWLTHGLPVVQTVFEKRTRRGSRQPDFVPAVRFRVEWPQDWERD